MKTMEKMMYWQRVGQRINPRKAVMWFFGINIPVVILINVLIAISGDYGREPNPKQLLVRAVIALVGFGIGFKLFHVKVIDPAIEEEARQSAVNENTSNEY